MVHASDHFDYTKLSVKQRLALIGDIWDSIDHDASDLSSAQRRELEQRLEDFRNNPDEGSSWEEVKARILGNQSQDDNT